MYLKGSAQQVAPGVEAAIWASIMYGYEETRGTFAGQDIGSNARSWVGTAGIDFSTSYAVFGLLGGFSDVQTEAVGGITTSAQSSTGGGYGVILIGNFSVDASLTATHTFSEEVPSTGRTLASNVTYRFIFGQSFLEPTAGLSWTNTWVDDDAAGQMVNNHDTLRVQGGARIGTSFNAGTVTIQPSLTGLLYSDVIITAEGSNTEGQLWGKAIGKLDFTWSRRFSSYVQGEVYGTEGEEDHIGYAVTVGGRLVF
jgi:hypothetical protein